MTVSRNTQAVLLLTSHFSKASSNSVKPLTPKEWGRFAVWLKDHALTPEQLMACHPIELLKGWSDRQITLDRLEALLNRGSALAIAMEKWLRAGLWVLTRSDADYPSRLKRRLGPDSPALLYGCGNQLLLDRGGSRWWVREMPPMMTSNTRASLALRLRIKVLALSRVELAA